MSNLAGKAYGLTVLTPSKVSKTWLNRAIFMISRAMPGFLAGLLGLSFIHFARWVIVKRDQWPDLGQGAPRLKHDYVIFCSNFNGTWDQYIDAFSDGIPGGLDLFWYSAIGYPHSIPITPFKDYIRANQIDNDYYYNATPGATQRDIKNALKTRAEILRLAELYRHATVPEFAKALRAAILGLQDCYSAQGLAPSASPDSDLADRERQHFINARWAYRSVKGQTHAEL